MSVPCGVTKKHRGVALGRHHFRDGDPGTVRGGPHSYACCKHCSKGKACGNTCISRAYVCHVGAGCACDR
jgi:hypothetical protein